MSPIDSFSGDYRFLSNFWQVDVTYEGQAYPSTEHAFQAAKTMDVERRRQIAALPRVSDAKAAGKKLKLRPDWEQVKLHIMEEILRLKFAHPDLAGRLAATRGRVLVEGAGKQFRGNGHSIAQIVAMSKLPIVRDVVEEIQCTGCTD